MNDPNPNGYATWRENFSQSAAAGPSLGGPAAVPEPASILLALLGIAALPATRGRRRR